MTMRGPLRRELGKYRRGRSGMIPGSSGFRGGRHYVAGSVPYGRPMNPYMWGLPHDYHPNMDSPAAQSDEYVTDPDWESHQAPLSHEDRVLRPFAPAEPREPDFDYDQAQVHGEFFLKAMEAQYQAIDEGQEVPTLANLWQEHLIEDLVPQLDADEPPEAFSGLESPSEQSQRDLPDLWDIATALGHLQKVLPEDHPDIVNLRGAVHEILEHPERMPQLEDFGIESTESKLGPGNPYEADMFGLPEPEPMMDSIPEAHGYGLDEGPNALGAEYGGLEALLGMYDAGFEEQGGLERVVDTEASFEMPLNEMGSPEAGPYAMDTDLGIPGAVSGDANPMTPELEIEQAVEAAMQPSGPPEMEEELDPFQAAQQMFDQQMQYMDNPFMMPGMGPMLGPAPGM